MSDVRKGESSNRPRSAYCEYPSNAKLLSLSVEGMTIIAPPTKGVSRRCPSSRLNPPGRGSDRRLFLSGWQRTKERSET